MRRCSWAKYASTRRWCDRWSYGDRYAFFAETQHNHTSRTIKTSSRKLSISDPTYLANSSACENQTGWHYTYGHRMFFVFEVGFAWKRSFVHTRQHREVNSNPLRLREQIQLQTWKETIESGIKNTVTVTRVCARVDDCSNKQAVDEQTYAE